MSLALLGISPATASQWADDLLAYGFTRIASGSIAITVGMER
jgi:hypothetical protein